MKSKRNYSGRSDEKIESVEQYVLPDGPEV